MVAVIDSLLLGALFVSIVLSIVECGLLFLILRVYSKSNVAFKRIFYLMIFWVAFLLLESLSYHFRLAQFTMFTTMLGTLSAGLMLVMLPTLRETFNGFYLALSWIAVFLSVTIIWLELGYPYLDYLFHGISSIPPIITYFMIMEASIRDRL